MIKLLKSYLGWLIEFFFSAASQYVQNASHHGKKYNAEVIDRDVATSSSDAAGTSAPPAALVSTWPTSSEQLLPANHTSRWTVQSQVPGKSINALDVKNKQRSWIEFYYVVLWRNEMQKNFVY